MEWREKTKQTTFDVPRGLSFPVERTASTRQEEEVGTIAVTGRDQTPVRDFRGGHGVFQQQGETPEETQMLRRREIKLNFFFFFA